MRFAGYPGRGWGGMVIGSLAFLTMRRDPGQKAAEGKGTPNQVLYRPMHETGSRWVLRWDPPWLRAAPAERGLGCVCGLDWAEYGSPPLTGGSAHLTPPLPSCPFPTTSKHKRAKQHYGANQVPDWPRSRRWAFRSKMALAQLQSWGGGQGWHLWGFSSSWLRGARGGCPVCLCKVWGEGQPPANCLPGIPT